MSRRWSFCKRCGFPFVPEKPRQEFCSWLCERNENEKEDPGRRSGVAMRYIVLRRKVGQGWMEGDSNYVKLFESENEDEANRFLNDDIDDVKAKWPELGLHRHVSGGPGVMHVTLGDEWLSMMYTMLMEPIQVDSAVVDNGGIMTTEDKDKAGDRLKKVVDSVEECREQVVKLCKIMDGLYEFASIRDAEDAGDWVVVANTADLVSRCLKDLNANLVEATDPGDTGDVF